MKAEKAGNFALEYDELTIVVQLHIALFWRCNPSK